MSCYDADQRSEFENHAEYLHKKMRVKAKQINKLKSASIQNQHQRHYHHHQSKVSQCFYLNFYLFVYLTFIF